MMLPKTVITAPFLAGLVFVIFIICPVLAAEPLWTMDFPDNGSHQGVQGLVTLSPDNSFLVTSNPDGTGMFVISINGTILWTYHPEKIKGDWTDPFISGIAISSDCSSIGVSVMVPGCCRGITTETPSNRVTVFDTGGQILWNYSTGEPPHSIAFSKNSGDFFVGYERSLACFSRDGMIRWNYTTDSPVSRIEVSPDGDYILASGENTGGQYTNDVYVLTTNGELLWKNQFRGENVIGISPDGRDLIVSGYPAYDTYSFSPDGKTRWEHSFFDLGTITALTTDGRYILAGTEDQVQLLDNRDEKIWNYPVPDPVYSVSLSGDGDIIGIGTGTGLIVLNRSGSLLWEYRMNGTVYPVTVSDDGMYVAALTDRLSFFRTDEKLSGGKPTGIKATITPDAKLSSQPAPGFTGISGLIALAGVVLVMVFRKSKYS